jgi:hypothetical protein
MTAGQALIRAKIAFPTPRGYHGTMGINNPVHLRYNNIIRALSGGLR